MLDLDGTIYQTLDLKEGAWHATIANGRSIGIEIANIGAYPAEDAGRARSPRGTPRDHDGRTADRSPSGLDGRRHPRPLRPRSAPSRDEPVVGTIQGQELRQYDLTPQQYDSLIKLTATLCTVFPKIRATTPATPPGKLVPKKLADADSTATRGSSATTTSRPTRPTPAPPSSGIASSTGRRP